MISILALAALPSVLAAQPRTRLPAITPSIVAPAPVAPPPVVVAPAGPDRSSPPPVTPPVVMEFPEPEVHLLRPGVEAWYVHVPGVRHVEVSVIVRNGRIQRPESAAAWYAVSATADLATQTLSSAELSELEDLHSMDVYTQLGPEQGAVAFDATRDDLAPAWSLLTDMIHASAPPRADLRRYVTDTKEWYLNEAPASQSAVAEAAMNFAWTPKGHPYGERPDLDSFSGLNAAGITRLYKDWLRHGPVRVLVVGDIPWAEAEPHVIAAVDGIGADVEPAKAPEVVPPKATRVIGVDMPGQQQAALQMRVAAPWSGAADRVAFKMINWVLGGHFLSRLNTNLREDKGYTYGAGSSYQADRTFGYATLRVDVPSEHTKDAIVEIERELDRLVAEGVPATDREMAYRSWAAAWNNQFQTASSAVGLYNAVSREDSTVKARRDRIAAAQTLTTEATLTAAQAWLGKDKPRVWVVVGDRTQVAPQLNALGWTVEWVSPESAILGSF
jgi:predicted Zn-dependent peptidase